MSVKAIIGGWWGDEGKGKIVYDLAENADVVARGTGGNNAGHTVYLGDDKTALHCIPAGIVSPNTTNIIGKGMVVPLSGVYDELKGLEERGLYVRNRVLVSDKTNIILPHYAALDGILEEMMSRSGKPVGTTRKGIGPAYMFKAARADVTFGDLLDDGKLRERLEINSAISRRFGQSGLFGLFGLRVNPDKVRDELLSEYERLEKYIQISNTDALLNKYVKEGKNILLEGAQGTLLSLEHGTRPYVTSSDSTLNGLCSGVGIASSLVDDVYIVFKIYPTRVGEGCMPTLMDEETNNIIVKNGEEFGATTGRKRRCGWFDTVAARYSSRVNGATNMVLTRLDILDNYPEVCICTGYELPDGSRLGPDEFPTNTRILEQCNPLYETMPGWEKTKDIREYDKLPKEARNYIERLESLVGLPATMLSNGPKRHELIYKS